MYKPAILFRAKCFAKTPLDVISGRHYEAIFPKRYKTSYGAINFAKHQIEGDKDVWQLPASKQEEESE